MKLFELKKEIWLWVIILLPVAYLVYVWNTLPEIIPTHFGMDGKPNDWSHKTMYAWLIPGMCIGIYLLMTFIPYIDPKKKLEVMGSKYFMFKLFAVLFMCILSIFIVRSARAGSIGDLKMLFVILGAMFVFLGNYLQRVRPNYFIGFRTPWSLENEDNWRRVHLLGGRLYFVAGLATIVLSFMLENYAGLVFLILVSLASVIPCVYSFVLYKKWNNGSI